MDKALRKSISRGQPLHILCEAGPCGFVIERHLSAQGLTCEVIAPPSQCGRCRTKAKRCAHGRAKTRLVAGGLSCTAGAVVYGRPRCAASR